MLHPATVNRVATTTLLSSRRVELSDVAELAHIIVAGEALSPRDFIESLLANPAHVC